MDEVELARLRREYEAVGLAEADVPTDPFTLFDDWLDCAAEAKLAEVNAMVLTTVDGSGAPSSRMVLCKGVDARGFVFYTNYGSRKAREIAERPDVALLFPWHPLGRQVRVEGTAARVARAESEAYFANRPRGAQLSAWASVQSSAVADRGALEARMADVERTYDGTDVPCPPHWGGIRVVPQAIEFWQGRADRLHDRLVYARDGDGWSVVRLAP